MSTYQAKPRFLYIEKGNKPGILKEHVQWVLWKTVCAPDKKKKWDKEQPFNAKSGRRASSTVPDNWSNSITVSFKKYNLFINVI